MIGWSTSMIVADLKDPGRRSNRVFAPFTLTLREPAMARDRLIEASCLVKRAFLVCAPHKTLIQCDCELREIKQDRIATENGIDRCVTHLGRRPVPA